MCERSNAINMSTSPRHRRSGSWLARILSPAAPPSASPSPQRSDSESRYSHRSTAAEVPVTSELPTYAESAAQTDTESLERFIQRVEAARRLIRGSFDRVSDPPIPKRIKIRSDSHVYERPLLRIPASSDLPPLDPPSQPQFSEPEMLPEPVLVEEEECKEPVVPQEDTAVQSEATEVQFQPPANIMQQPSSPQRIPVAPAPSPQSSSASSPSIAFGKEKSAQGVHPPVVRPQTTHSFFVDKPPAEEDFFEDSGIVGGEDDSSDDQGDDPQPPSLFSAPQRPASLFQPLSNSAVPGGSSLFGGPPSLFAGNPASVLTTPLLTPTTNLGEKTSLFGNLPPGSLFKPPDSQSSTPLFSSVGGTGRPSLFTVPSQPTSAVLGSAAPANLAQPGKSLFAAKDPPALFNTPPPANPPLFTIPLTPSAPVSLFSPASAVSQPTLFTALQPGASSTSPFGGGKPAPSLFPNPVQTGGSWFRGENKGTGSAFTVVGERPKGQEAAETKEGGGKPLQPGLFGAQRQPLGEGETKTSGQQLISGAETGPKQASLTFNSPIFVFNPPPFAPTQQTASTSSQPSPFTPPQQSPFSSLNPSQAASPFTPTEGQTVFQSSPSSSGFSLAPPTNTPTDPTPPTP